MAIGMKALFWSADQIELSEATEDKPAEKGIGKGWFVLSMFAALVLVIGMFTVLPTLIGGWLSPWIGEQSFLRNAAETALRLVILLTYMLLVSRTKDIKRTFAYHGAEHKAIACYEAGGALTVDECRGHSRFHPRCGTSFLLTVVLISMVAFLLLSIPLQSLDVFENRLGNNFLRVGMRLALLPFVIAVSYEINRLVGRTDNIISRVFRAPGITMQRITTREPDDDMIEVALDALRRVVPDETGKDEWGHE
jgi:uncharacterized protein YqhQ